jgi:N-dimethylarginine dimethylaminohydrolase
VALSQHNPLFREYDTLRRVAVCRPTHYALRQPINLIQASHVAAGDRISSETAAANHAELVAVLQDAGVEIVQVAPDRRFPYQLNTRDAALGTPGGAILARFSEVIRQGEEQLVQQAIEDTGGAVAGAMRSAVFEGGDFVALSHRRAALGLGARTQPSALEELRILLGSTTDLSGVPFDGRYLHLDMVFNVVADRLALACPSALPPDFLFGLRQDGFRILDVSEREVFQHTCNVLALNGQRIVSHTANQRMNEALRAEGLEVDVVDVSELAKSGGGPRCLTLPLERGP